MSNHLLDETITYPADFARVAEAIQSREGYVKPVAFAVGLAYQSQGGTVLCVRYPYVNLRENYGAAAIFREASGIEDEQEREAAVLNAFRPFVGDGNKHPNIDALNAVITMASDDEYVGGKVSLVFTFIDDLDKPPVDAADVYLRLHLLSHRKVLPNTINLDGIFGLLTNVCWTDAGPVAESEYPEAAQKSMSEDGYPLIVRSVDKFPPMLDFVVPRGVRIADGNRVRLGAYVGVGTTVMHEGFINFNAGTLGKSMVEGRISQGVTVDNGSDIGGGASIMGTLSGGGTEKITVGKRCLIGANAGIGISLGDDCKVEAGLYVTAGMLVRTGKDAFVKASVLSGASGKTFRRNSRDGIVEAVPTKGVVELNAALHSNSA